MVVSNFSGMSPSRISRKARFAPSDHVGRLRLLTGQLGDNFCRLLAVAERTADSDPMLLLADE